MTNFGSFVGVLGSIKSLILENNQISTLDSDQITTIFPNLTHLYLNHNDLKCRNLQVLYSSLNQSIEFATLDLAIYPVRELTIQTFEFGFLYIISCDEEKNYNLIMERRNEDSKDSTNTPIQRYIGVFVFLLFIAFLIILPIVLLVFKVLTWIKNSYKKKPDDLQNVPRTNQNSYGFEMKPTSQETSNRYVESNKYDSLLPSAHYYSKLNYFN